MDKKYIEILQALLVSEQMRMLSKNINTTFRDGINYSIEDLDELYFELENLNK